MWCSIRRILLNLQRNQPSIILVKLGLYFLPRSWSNTQLYFLFVSKKFMTLFTINNLGCNSYRSICDRRITWNEIIIDFKTFTHIGSINLAVVKNLMFIIFNKTHVTNMATNDSQLLYWLIKRGYPQKAASLFYLKCANNFLTATHAIPAIQAFITSAAAHGYVSAGIAGRCIALHALGRYVHRI